VLFAGLSGAGSILVTGTSVGEHVIAIFGAPTAGGALLMPGAVGFETQISVAGYIQLAGNLSFDTFIAILRQASVD
jgi:hypothetical protein